MSRHASSSLLRWLAGATAALLLVAGAAAAATLRTTQGSKFEVQSVPRLMLPGLAGQGLSTVGGGLRYTVTDEAGRTWTGAVPGTQQMGDLSSALAESPLSGQVFLVYGSKDEANLAEVSFTYWGGQGWAEPRPLAPREGRVDSLQVAFMPQGDAVLAWESQGQTPTILFRHVELSTSGEGIVYAFLDVGPHAGLLQPVGDRVQMAEGLAHVALGGLNNAAYVFLSEPERDSMGLLRIDLDRGMEGGGFGAPPVPATLTMGLEAAAATPVPGASGTIGGEPDGRILSPFRMQLLGADVYYWLEADAARAVAFRGGVAGPLVTIPLAPSEAQTHFDVLRVMRQDILRQTRADGAAPGRERTERSARR